MVESSNWICDAWGGTSWSRSQCVLLCLCEYRLGGKAPDFDVMCNSELLHALGNRTVSQVSAAAAGAPALRRLALEIDSLYERRRHRAARR